MARHEYYIRCRTENEWECENPLNNVIFLQDEYDKYWNKIKSGDNFAFSRYADEEYALMMGRAVRAQEGWHVGNEITLLGKRLLETLTPPQTGMVYGISCPCCDSEAYYWYLYHISNAGISFSNIWNTKNFQKFMNDFSALERDAVLITNYRGVGKEYGKLHIIRHYAVDDDCVNFYENGYDTLVEKISGEIGERKNLLYAVSAGPLSGIIIWELFKRNPENCYVDFGSALDIFTHGRITRPFMNESNPLNKKKCWMFANDSTQTDVDVVLTAYKRPDALQIQLDAVLNQTLKPKHVFLYQDGIDSYYSINFKQEILEKLDDYHVSDTNGGVWKRFEYARKVAQSKYVCVFDDDTIPGRRWLENCHIHMMQHQGIYGSNGFLLSDFDYPYKSGGIHVGWHVPNELAAEVDFSGHSWFFEKEWLEWMLAKDYRHKYKYVGEDMGLSFACKEKGKRTYVPSHPESILSLWGSLPHYGNKFGGSGAPVSENNNNLLAMNHALQEYHADGWTPIFEDDPGYVEKMRLFELKIRYWEKDGHIDISSNEEMEQKVLQSMERFKSAKLTHDILQIAFALLSAKPIMVLSKLRESRERAEFVESFLRVFIWGAFLTIKQGNHSLALAFLTAIKETYLLLQEVEPIIVSFCEGMVYYYRQEYAMAEQCFIQYLGSFPRDEEAFFYLGNAAAYQNAIERASEAYNNALMIKKNYTEVFENVELLSSLVEQKNYLLPKEGKVGENFRKYSLKMDGQVVWDLPVFINVRDRLFGLKKLIAWLLDAGHNKIYILDNASSYPPLLKYYETLNKSESVHVLYLKRNLGPHALWNSGVLNVLRVQTPYVYTDSDILPEASCPKNAVEFLLEILRQNPLLLKAGLGLGTNVASYVGEDLERERNEQRLSMPLSENVYFGTVRTTFALYRNCYHNDDFFAAWTGGNLMARHLQWELDYNNLSEEDIYYMNHADARFSEVIRSQGMKKQSL